MPKKKVLNVFISQPMNGRTKEEILAEHKWVMQALGIANPYKKTWEIHVIDSYSKDVPDDVEELREPRLWYLGDSIKLLAYADLFVALSTRWWPSRGCLVERETAEVYDIPIVYNPIEDPDGLKHSLRSAMRLKNKLVYNK